MTFSNYSSLRCIFKPKNGKQRKYLLYVFLNSIGLVLRGDKKTKKMKIKEENKNKKKEKSRGMQGTKKETRNDLTFSYNRERAKRP